MDKILVFTDIHIMEEGRDIIGLDPAERFGEALSHALRHHGDARHIILTGDLTHHGRPAQYARLRELLAEVGIPITFLLGNHDNRANFRDAFPDAPVDDHGFVQTSLDLGHYRLVCLDTLDAQTEPFHGGRLCPARLEWLDAQCRSGPVVVLQHHHPAPVGFDGMDRIALSNGAEELALLARHDVRHLVFGHIHRTISGAFGDLAFTCFKSPCHQMPMRLGEASSASSVDEPGAYGILLLGVDRVIAHSEDFALAQHAVREDPTSRG